MAVKARTLFYMRDEGDGANICVQIVHFFCWVQCLGITFAALYFYIKPNCMTMKRMLNRMLRYADAIVKRGVDKLIDAIGHSAEPQTENAETPQRKKRMRNDTDCAPQTTGHTTNCGLTEQTITLMGKLYDIRYNVLDRTPEVQRRDQADKGFVPVNKLVRNTMVIDLHKRGCMVWNNDVDRIVESAYMPQYHPFSAYLQALPQWDGTDRVGVLAERVSTDALWRTVFGRWLRCMVAGWVQATAGGASTCGNAIAAMIKTSPTAATYSTLFLLYPYRYNKNVYH